MHKPVLLEEVVQFLKIKADGKYVDGTLGLGGHAEALVRQLGPHGRLLGLDVDPENLAQAKDRLQPLGDLTITRRLNFQGLPEILRELGWAEVEGVILDLGISSKQLDTPQRGFSFQKEGPLDMRMDPDQPTTAYSFLLKVTEEELTEALKKYGQFRGTSRLSREMLKGVTEGHIKTTKDISQLCERLLGRTGGIHPATRVFLALRSLVNDEEGALKKFLEFIPSILAVKGRVGIISFHSIEDRPVKQRFLQLEKEGYQNKEFRRVTKKPVTPLTEELKQNPRSRSAKFRVMERIA